MLFQEFIQRARRLTCKIGLASFVSGSLSSSLYELLQALVVNVGRSPFGNLIAGQIVPKLHDG